MQKERLSMSKDEAIIKVLRVLRSQSAAVNKSNREEALTLAEAHGITVTDLINEYDAITRRI
jgi:hypothetical protein